MAYAKSNILLSQNELAKLSKLTARTVSNRLVGCPFELKGVAHMYRLADALPLLTKGSGPRDRLAEAQATLAELELATRCDKVVPAAFMIHMLTLLATETRNLIRSAAAEKLPQQICDDIELRWSKVMTAPKIMQQFRTWKQHEE